LVRSSAWLLLVGCTGDPGPGDDGTEPVEDTGWPGEWAALEDEVLALVNQRRWAGASCDGLHFVGQRAPLEMDEILRGVARAHSADMAARDYFSHDNPDGEDPDDRIEEIGFSGAAPWGENIAAGSATAAGVVDQWIDSEGHCDNIMLPDYTVIGIGYAFDPGSEFGHYWTQNFAGSH
jgi:uncharacterized protein YkwD